MKAYLLDEYINKWLWKLSSSAVLLHRNYCKKTHKGDNIGCKMMNFPNDYFQWSFFLLCVYTWSLNSRECCAGASCPVWLSLKLYGVDYPLPSILYPPLPPPSKDRVSRHLHICIIVWQEPFMLSNNRVKYSNPHSLFQIKRNNLNLNFWINNLLNLQSFDCYEKNWIIFLQKTSLCCQYCFYYGWCHRFTNK